MLHCMDVHAATLLPLPGCAAPALAPHPTHTLQHTHAGT